MQKSVFHRHEVVEAGEHLDIVSPLKDIHLPRYLRENQRGCRKPEGEAVVNIILPLLLEPDEGFGSGVKRHVVVPRHQVEEHRLGFRV